jgi:hypothetical protein
MRGAIEGRGPWHKGIVGMGSGKRGRPRKEGERYPSKKLKVVAARGRPRGYGERYPSGDLKPAKPVKINSSPPAMSGAEKYLAGLLNSVAVYVICQGDYEVKIGVSKDVGARSRSLQTSNSKQLNIYWAVRFDRADAYRLEKQIHKDFRGSMRHIRGEHYMMSGAEAVDLIKRYAKKLQLRMITDLRFGYGETEKFAEVRAVAR